MKKILALILLAVSLSAQARWIQFDDDKTGTIKYYYDNETVAWDNNNGLVQIAWIKGENPDKTKNVMRIETHCPGRFYRIVVGNTYNSQGQVINGMAYTPDQSWNPIIPGTVGDTIYKKLCTK
jgi:hypothetical protein